jgi:hypothetical protein
MEGYDARVMRGRPIPVVVISLVLIATGAGALVSHTVDRDYVWVALESLAAIVAGVFLLRASNWARWLALGWIAFHVVVSFSHSGVEFAVHIVVFAAFAYFLFRGAARSTQALTVRTEEPNAGRRPTHTSPGKHEGKP